MFTLAGIKDHKASFSFTVNLLTHTGRQIYIVLVASTAGRYASPLLVTRVGERAGKYNEWLETPSPSTPRLPQLHS